MYKRHRIAGASIFVIILVVAFLLDADYSKISEAAISVVSIALAVYIGAASVILGSDFADKLKRQRDIEIKTKTGLGVLASYLRIAGFCGLATIAISAVYLLDMDFQAIREMLIQWQYGTFWLATIPKVLSALSCALFAVNVFFIWLILVFLINSMAKSV